MHFIRRVFVILAKIPLLLPLKWRRAFFDNRAFRPIRKKISQLIGRGGLVTVPLDEPLKGHHMKINLQMQKSYMYGTYEPELCDAILSYVAEGSICIDIGANIGYTTLLMAKMAGRHGKVYSFEPLPENFLVLKQNIALNQYTNVICENIALSDRHSMETMRYRTETFTAGGSIVSEKPLGVEEGYQEVSVQAMSLDEYVKSHSLGKIDFVKIDVEGAEGLVIAGMHNVIEKYKPVIILEPHYVVGSTLNSALSQLHDLNVEIVFLASNHMLING